MFLNEKRKKKLMFWSAELLLLASLIFVFTKIRFVFSPVFTFFQTLFAPFLIAGFLFYLLNPLVKMLMKIRIKKFKVKRPLAIAVVFLLLISVLGLVISFFIPRLIEQIKSLVIGLPGYLSELQRFLTNLFNNSHIDWLQKVDLHSYMNKFEGSLTSILKKFILSLTTSLGSVIGTITSVTVTLVTVPFILFYMLKDGEKLVPTVEKFFPEHNRSKVARLLHEMSATLSRYISGQMIECLFVGTFSAIGYSMTGIPYALLVGLFAGITNIIPYLGPYIGLMPALFLAFSKSLPTVFWVIVVCIVVQQLDGNLVYPNVIGKSLHLHPLTIIIILLVAGNIAGLLGMILGVPLYAVTKVVVKFVYDIGQIRTTPEKEQSKE
ncbi:AI-2E family transporter [Ligilactobacillus aviarius]|uniref:AI-2E family transporter n=1 Tax=Ligilactobacillus aviarius TaxID=1606 RepID=UPI0007D9273D|nr:AI-2E family transporter [Ligilactobacillus aviarius]OAQ01553.1 AI-2E family transporter [Ligilactobacillus aviarius]OAQ02767.1 AI-2E family transporter [Ligilactobacillus aviarius]OAQ07729.1 AI-2E family transporter [Ligilactobacillus aviarius]OAS75494.1 AI-2E family transporter [Ligilactobacillus aviarius]OAS78435.1 AI-2E family transporter [Ligilactobacillus aviarius]